MKKLGIVMAMLIMFAGLLSTQSNAQNIFAGTDKGMALRIHNTGKEVVKVYTYGDSCATNKVVIGATSTTIDTSGAITVASLAALIEACADVNGLYPLKCDQDCVVATSESVDDEMVANVTGQRIEPGSWGAIYFTTADVEHFDVYLPASDNGAARGALDITEIYGSIGGTGNVLIGVYKDQVLVDYKIIVSPVYVLGVSSATNVADEISPGELGWTKGAALTTKIHVGKDESVLVRATRTAGTTGGIGIRVEQAK